MNPLVSVIVLTFNSQEYIGRALASLRSQTYSEIEIIVVDAGSTDRTRQIVSGFADVIWLELLESDMGMARNYGVKHSKGECLMFLDSDDFYLEHKVESQIEFMKGKSDLGVLFGTAYIYRNGCSDRLGIKKYSHQRLTLADFLYGGCYTLATICIRRSVWDAGLCFGEGDQGRYGEDWRFQLGIARRGVTFDLLDDPAVVVELREGGHTSWEIQPKMKALGLSSVESALASMTTPQAGGIDRQAVLNAHRFRLAGSLLLVGQLGSAREILHNINSFSRRTLVRLLLILAWILPTPCMRRLLETVWMLRQNSSFQWLCPSPKVKGQIINLTNNPKYAQ